MTDEMAATEYFNIYKRLMLTKPEIVYNYLQEEYKEKRFGSLENFKKYQSDNINEINQLQLQKYFINKNDQYTEIVCADQNQNYYIFDETQIMNFELKLDTYTLISDKFKQRYDSSANEHKVAMNIDNWVQMLNTRDYVNSYNVLNETFRNNKWKSEQEYEKYIKEKLPLHYTIEYTTYSKENDTYVQTIELKEINNEDATPIKINIIMQLKENYQYIMSFSVE